MSHAKIVPGQGYITLPASVFKPILLFFSAFGDDMLITMNEQEFRIQAMSSDHTHFLNFVALPGAATRYVAPKDEHLNTPLRFSTGKLPIALRSSYTDTIMFCLPPPNNTGFTIVLACGNQRDELRFIEKELESDPFNPPDTAETCMQVTFNARELCDDVNVFMHLGFDSINIQVEPDIAVILDAADATNETMERRSTYGATGDRLLFAGGMSVCDAEGDVDSNPRAKRKAVSVPRQPRSVLDAKATRTYSKLSVSSKLLLKLCQCTNMCDEVTLESRAFPGAGQLLCLNYALRHDDMTMQAFLAPKIKEDDD